MESKELFFYELEGRGYIFQNKKWDEAKHGFEDDMLNMAWEMWSSAKHSVKSQAVPEGFVLFPKKQTSKMRSLARDFDARLSLTKYEQLHNIWVKQAMIEAQEQKG